MLWLFGYGSLLPAGSSELPTEVVPCCLLGWQRTWGVAMDNSVDLPGYKHYLAADGSRPEVMVAFLDIAPREGAKTNGMVVPVEPDELPGLDRRERNYARTEVTGQLDCSLPGRTFTYVGLAQARARAARGAQEGRLVVARSYRERVREGFERLGQGERFEALTGPTPPLAELELITHSEPAEPRFGAGR